MSSLGWGQGTWGNNPWGGFVSAAVSVTGVTATSAVGDEGVTGSSVVVETGLSTTSAVGTAVAVPSIEVVVSGVAGTGNLGSAVFLGDSNFAVTGVAGTSAVGEEGVTGTSIVVETGLSATTSVNSVTTEISVSVSTTGVEATIGFMTGWGNDTWGAGVWGGGVFADVGQTVALSTNVASALVQTPTILGNCSFAVSGVAGTGGIGDALGAGGAKVVEDGLTGTVNIGDEAVSGSANISVTGVSASADVSQLREDPISLIVTVYDDGGGNKYYIDGVKQATLTLYVGNTYRFDQSDSSNAGHPLRLSSISDGTHAEGPEYTTGVTTNGTPGSSGAYTQIVIAEDTPTLYYYCSNHSGMGGQVNIATTFTVATTTGAPVTTVVGTMALGSESVTAGATATFTTFNELSISLDTLAISGTSVVSLIGISVSGLTGEENVWGLIEPTQEANWIERVA